MANIYQLLIGIQEWVFISPVSVFSWAPPYHVFRARTQAGKWEWLPAAFSHGTAERSSVWTTPRHKHISSHFSHCFLSDPVSFIGQNEWNDQDHSQEEGKPNPSTRRLLTRNKDINAELYYRRVKHWSKKLVGYICELDFIELTYKITHTNDK